MRVGCAMLVGGNRSVQEEFQRCLRSGQAAAGFFRVMYQRLDDADKAIKANSKLLKEISAARIKHKASVR